MAAALLAPAPPARADEAMEMFGLPAPGTTPPRLERRLTVQYPAHLRDRGISGVVLVRARVGRDGRVRETRVEHSGGELDEPALAHVRRHEFTPARQGEIEVEAWVLVPVRFEPSAPRGTHGADPVDVERYTDLDRSFESDVAVLMGHDPAPPGEEDAELRRRIMTGSLLLEVIPPPDAEAVRALMKGDSLSLGNRPDKQDRRRERWAAAAQLAPWWPLPYRRLAAAAVAEHDFEMAARCADIVLAGRPGDEWALALKRRARQIETSRLVRER